MEGFIIGYTIKQSKMADRVVRKSFSEKNIVVTKSKKKVKRLIMEKPIISIIAPAIRPQLWLEFYKMCCNGNIIPFEIVFVGPNLPSFKLPENFFFIHSNVKPPQCFEIACRNAKSEYVLIFTDDLIIPSGTIDLMYSYMIRMWNEKAIIGARFSDNPNPGTPDYDMFFDLNSVCSAVVACAVLIKKSVWEEVGGVDRRFNRLWSDTDLQMRIIAAGGFSFVVPSEKHIVRERRHDYPRLIQDPSKGKMEDRSFIDSLWINPDGSPKSERLDPVQSYLDSEIPIVR